MGAFKPWHIVVLLLVVLLLFGAGKLPSLARNVGKSMRIFKTEVEELRGDEPQDEEDEDDRPRRRAADDRDRRDAAPSREFDPRTEDRAAETVDHRRDDEPYRRD